MSPAHPSASRRACLLGGLALADWQLQSDADGDVLRLFNGLQLLDHAYWLGRPWTLALRRVLPSDPAQPLTLTVMPLREDSGIAFDPGVQPRFAEGQLARLNGARLRPVYEWAVDGPATPQPPAKATPR